MNDATNAYEVINAVLLIRIVEKYLSNRRPDLEGKDRLVAIHGNRFIEYCILQTAKGEDGFSNSIVINDQDSNKWLEKIDKLIQRIRETINELFIDSYPANIFKNVTKCKAIKDRI